jgi:acyl-coenzyme A thioesterase PaaI-like protein
LIIFNMGSIAPAIPEDTQSADQIDAFIQNHPVAIFLRNKPEYTEVRPHLKVAEQFRAQNFMTGALTGPRKISVPPYVFSKDNGEKLVMLMHLGEDLCDYPRVIHNGLIAALFDEGLARCCFAALPHKVGVTANLNIEHHQPLMANSYIVLSAETTKLQGRKAWGYSRIETLPIDSDEAILVAEAKGLFIEPKQIEVSFPGNLTTCMELRIRFSRYWETRIDLELKVLYPPCSACGFTWGLYC